MTNSLCDTLGHFLSEAGAAGWGIASAGPVEDCARDFYLEYLSKGYNASMEWLGRNLDARFTVDKILPGTRSIISVAFAYPDAPEPLSPRHPRWASYALGDDYHEVIRRRLAPVTEWLDEKTGGKSRICVDTAPVMERYWAVKAGVGFRGRNGMVIVSGTGAGVFLSEIFTTVDLPPSACFSGEISCRGCNRCVAACPSGALKGDGTVDARQCLSYLTIEHRGPLPDDTPVGDRIYGCDTCRMVCPHESGASRTTITEFLPRESVLALDIDAINSMSELEFSTMFRHSAIKRVKHAGLLRNVKMLLK